MGVSGEKDRRTGAPQQVLSALQRQPNRDLDIYLDEIRGGDLASLKQAVEAYRRAISLDPGYAWPYHSLGLIFEQRRDYEAALEYYHQALERHESHRHKAVLWYNIGNIQRELGNYE